MTLTAPDAVAARAALRRQLPPGLLACDVVDLDAVAGDVAVLREHAPGAQLMAVVKADGYGHGMVPVARAALAGGADGLAVATAEEARGGRAGGVEGRVLVMGARSEQELEGPSAAGADVVAWREA